MAEQDSKLQQAPAMGAKSSHYTPSPQDKAVIDDIVGKFDKWREMRRPHEIQWFLNTAFVRGNQWVTWNDGIRQLELPDAPPHKIRLVVNRIGAKVRTRLAKLTKNRPKPIVVPASTDRDDKLNARATQKVLEYLWRKLGLETKFKDALLWSMTSGKGFWWFYWNPQSTGRIQQLSPDGTPQAVTAQLGDPDVEVGSPFEVLVADNGIARIQDQPEIMRVKIRDIADVKQRYPEYADYLKADTVRHEMFQYERQIANLNAKGNAGALFNSELATSPKDSAPTQIIVKELFVRPCAKYPQGLYAVEAGGVLLKYQEELPYGFSDQANPYPVVEFADGPSPGNFWPATQVEQMMGIQKEYNNLRSKLAEHLKILIHPKIFIPIQAGIAKNAWTSESGEKIYYTWTPGLPEPKPFLPPPIARDSWDTLQLIQREFDDVSGIYPAAEGQSGEATSGFQTNLLQEAADLVHGPDIRSHELSLESAAVKLRRMVQLGYDIPRLVSIAGRNHQPDVFEFHQDQIDENADIIIYTGSALSDSPSVRTQQVMELYNSGIMGDQADPEIKRQARGMIDLGSVEEGNEITHRDEELARLENTNIERGQPVEMPKFWEDHNTHYAIHTDQLKSPEIWDWPEPQRQQLVAHVLLHVKFIDPNRAVQLAMEMGMNDMLPYLQQAAAQSAPQPGQPPQQGAPQEGQQAPPQAPQAQEGQPPPPPQAPQGPPQA